MLKRILDLSGLENLREKGVQRGLDTGFKSLDELFSIKPDTFTIIQGAPTHGKSELIFEILLNQAEHYGKRSVILSPETGNAEEITLELVHKYLRKTAYKTSGYGCTDQEYYKAICWIDEHFAIADDDDKSYSFAELTKEVLDYQKRENRKIDYVMAEPWNELDHKISLVENGGRQDLSIEDELSELRRFCKKNHKHVFLSFHPSHQQLEKGPNGTYYPMPKAREAAGGQATLRKAFTWINIWRPQPGMVDESGIPYEENEVLVQIEKSKPKGVGKKGIISLYFDWQKNRYYEYFNSDKSYAFEHERFKPLAPLPVSEDWEKEVLF